jgi:hypothetical protein
MSLVARKKMGVMMRVRVSASPTLTHDHPPRLEPLGDESQDTRRTLLRALARGNTANPVLAESSDRWAQECSEFHKQFFSERRPMPNSAVRNEQVAASFA